MSVDTNRIDLSCAFLHMVWAAPLACIITLVLLLVNLTYSAIAGFALLMIGVPLLTVAIRKLFRRRRAINKITDKRVSLTQEIIQSVRFVKYFGWEPAFLERLEQFRLQEISAIQTLLAIRNAMNAVSMSLPVFASMLSFITFSLTDHDLAPAKVFSSLALFNSLRIPLNLLPITLGEVTDAWSAVKRIEAFLLEEDREETMIWNPEGEYALELRDASFTWEKTNRQEKEKSKDIKPNASSYDSPTSSIEDQAPFTLQDLNFKAGRNELIAVIGTVGSGKSSLLASLAGHMRKTDGDAVLGASRAFCLQSAWIQNTSLRNNITFGKEFDKEWYEKIIDACALQPDLDSLPHGDQTEIGERGITISGGQKQRLNIARAIYYDAEIVLMDDPLSAVDAHVGRHIFDYAILGLLKDRCRILATHQLWVLDRCDRIVWMEAGKVQAIDTFENLRNNHQGFRNLMEMTAATSDEKKGTESEEDSEEVSPVGNQTKVEKHKTGTPLMAQEDRAEAAVSWSVYGAYVKASGGILSAPLIFLLLVLAQGSNISTSLWLSFWISDEFGYSTGLYIGVYAALGTVQALLMFTFAILLSVLGTRASKVMFRQAIKKVLHAPMSFFDITPLGRIINRLSRDVDVMDNNLSDAIRMYFFTIGGASAIFILTIAYYYYFAIAIVPFYLFYVGAAAYYRSSAREIKRHESVLRSTVFAKFSEGLSGVATIQAYNLKDRFVNELRSSIDAMNAAYYLTFANQRWLTLRLDTIGNLLVFIVGILVVTARFSVNPAISGLVLSYILSVVQMLQFSIRQLSEVDKGMNSVERIRYFGAELEEEASPGQRTIAVRESWPERGEVIFDSVGMRYRENLPLVLRGLSMHVEGGERVGIVGRTGAGKSSIMSSLFRLVELSEGSITIDGVDISQIDLQSLRSRLTIIPQDPTLFQGTVRSNLDPFHEHTDLTLWSALRKTWLIQTEADTNDDNKKLNSQIHLDSVVSENGQNFSLGQRQLLALARALVRDSRIIICDEATSSVDMETDTRIQHTLASGFAGKTLLCIAHRLQTIIGYDRICVVEAGQIAQMDTPAKLYREEGGIFRGMCDRSGIQLRDIEVAREGIVALDRMRVSVSTSN
ncbi:P-loop containing nucleoside triphosphate hydrolase protein [Aspergillus lucknowensis]|uniref:P-loop containing nucleoside triphosphate hydrolase protein n=1 Tax=Aspergillus lucknowensis TaxID=176173 RepID=A0ABR4LSN2_9EURO